MPRKKVVTWGPLIDRFWRFPHRNRLLRRENTPAPKTWLRESGVRFGQ